MSKPDLRELLSTKPDSRKTDSEQITEFLKNCTTSNGEPLLKPDEMADFQNGEIIIKKSHS